MSDGRSEPGGRSATASPARGGGEVPHLIAGEVPHLIDLLGETPETLHALLALEGATPREARAIVAAVVGRGEADLMRAKGLRRTVREAVLARAANAALRVVDRRESSDGFVKYLFELGDGVRVEGVRIPLPHSRPDAHVPPTKYTVCVSSQAGCSLRCAFCATGTMGLERNLTAGEIVAQVLAIRSDSTLPVRGVVFMGMGEPLLNYDAVVRAAQVLSNPSGGRIDAKSITISTAGVVPAIRRYTAEGHPYRLSVTLSAASHDKRRALMPHEKAWPVDDLAAALRERAAVTGERQNVAWVALGGVNCGADDAAALGALLGDVPMRLDLVEMNGDTGGFRAPDGAELSAFRSYLAPLGIPVARRYSGGKEEHAACGMLVGRAR